MHDELASEFDRMFVELARRSRTGAFSPNTDVFLDVHRQCIIVHVELAGANAESISIGVVDQSLYISGQRVDRSNNPNGSILLKEIEYGEFAKKLHLPVPIDSSEAVASYRDGILTISLPFSTAKAFPSHRTEIRMTIRRVSV